MEKKLQNDQKTDVVPIGRMRWMQLATVMGFVLLVVFFFLPRVDVMEWLEAHRIEGPWLFYLAFALLTLVGFPSTPFFIVGGAAFPLWQNLVGAVIGMLLHFTLAHLISARWMSRAVRRLLENRGMTPPSVEAGNVWKTAVMIKFAPGIPMFLKTYMMGVAGIPLHVMLAVSVPATLVYALALFTLGMSAMQGGSGWLLGGAALVIFAVAGWRYLRARKLSE